MRPLPSYSRSILRVHPVLEGRPVDHLLWGYPGEVTDEEPRAPTTAAHRGFVRSTLDAPSTALVLVDLHYGTLTTPLRPYSAAQIVKNATALGRGFEAIGAMIVLTHVAFPWWDDPDQDFGGLRSMMCDGVPPGWSEFTPAVRSLRADIVLAKGKWSAFEGTDLDSQLQRRRINTVVIAGLTTNVAVEFTARDASQRDYSVIIAEDAVASIDLASHRFSVEEVLPRMAAVCTTTEILAACSRPASRYRAAGTTSQARLPVRTTGTMQSLKARL
jgi:nicotinamidase-related amidase